MSNGLENRLGSSLYIFWLTYEIMLLQQEKKKREEG